MASINVVLGEEKKDGTRQIYLKVNHNSTSAKLKLPAFATKRQVGKNGKIIDTELNMRLYNMIGQLNIDIIDLGIASLNMTAKEILEAVESRKKTKENDENFRLDWMKWLDEVIAEKKKRPGRTWEGYRSAKVAFGRYMDQRGMNEVDINDLKKSTMIDFMEWMENDGKIGPSGRELYMTYLLAAHNMAKKRYNDEDDPELKIPRSPFSGVTYKLPACDKNNRKNNALSSEQMRWLWEAPIPEEKRLKRSRNAFFMSFFLCGMNSCDMFDLPLSVEKDVVEYDRKKVVGRIGESAHIRLAIDERIMPVVDEYRGKRSFFNFQDNFNDEQSMNKSVNNGLKIFVERTVLYYALKWQMSLEETKKKLGVSKALTYYTARHTWASIAVNECHIAMDLVDRCLCHITDSVAAKSYVKRDYTSINDANRMVIEKVFGEQ